MGQDFYFGQKCSSSCLLKSIFYKSNLENPSVFKISPNGPHISVHPARKYAAYLGKIWRQVDFPSCFYKKWTLLRILLYNYNSYKKLCHFTKTKTVYWTLSNFSFIFCNFEKHSMSKPSLYYRMGFLKRGQSGPKTVFCPDEISKISRIKYPKFLINKKKINFWDTSKKLSGDQLL